MGDFSPKAIVTTVVVILLFILGIMFNPFGVNTAGNRVVVQQFSGHLNVQSKPGWYWSGFMSTAHIYPDVMTVVFAKAKKEIKSDVAARLLPCEVRFNDAAKAEAEATVRWRLPSHADDMIKIHKEYKSYQKLAETALSRYTSECLKFTAQLMESETHYSGGMSQFSEDFQDQLQNGQYLVDQLEENHVIDSSTRETERVYVRKKRRDANGKYVRNTSDIQQFNITLATATIDHIDYEPQIDEKLKKKIEASTRESISKQNLITAQQEASTAKAEGERKLVEIEYTQRQEQTQLVVQAQTRVKVAEQDKEEQKIALEGAKLEAAKIKALADAEAYKKQKVMAADGALDKKLKAYIKVQQGWASAFSDYKGNLVPQVVTGGNGSGGSALNLMEIMTIKAAKDLGLNTKVN